MESGAPRAADGGGPGAGPLPRRAFLAASFGAVAAGALAGCGKPAWEEFLQKHFKELSAADLKALLSRLEEKYTARFGRPVRVGADPPVPGTAFAYGLDLSRCIGCRRCVYACVKENNPSRSPQIHWIQVLEMEASRGIDLEAARLHYEHDSVPAEGKFYMPVQCQQCRRPPCVKACPVEATWREPDGMVVVDYNWCIGCRCCMAACPYGARHFNWADPGLPAAEVNTDTHVLGNRPRARGVVEKCTLCIQRVRRGRYPACVEICPTGTRKFGNLLDENSEIRLLMKRKRVFVFKAELNTQPAFYYFYGL